MLNLTLILILAATVVTGLLAGMSLDKAAVQLPARHRMGIIAFAGFSRANDLGNGLIAYPMFGIAAALLTLGAGVAAFASGTPLSQAWPIYVSASLALLHSAATARAAPNMLRLRRPTDEEAVLASTLDNFARWHNVRAILQLLNFIALIAALVTYIGVH